MLVNVKILTEHIVIPVDEQQTVQKLMNEAILRYEQLCNPTKSSSSTTPEGKSRTQTTATSTGMDTDKGRIGGITAIRRLRDHAILMPTDLIRDVLTNEECVTADFQPLSSWITMQQEDSGFQPSLDDCPYLNLDGDNLTLEQLVALGAGEYRIALSKETMQRVKNSRHVVDDIVSSNRIAYGITTGFGMFASTVIGSSQLKELQLSLLRSHAAGVGKPLSLRITRMLFALRINVLAKGFSGISLETLEQMVCIFNASCLPWIPEQGTVGASGDLAPLAHLALGLTGEGTMWSPLTGWTTAKDALTANKLQPLNLKPKEGLSMINGTQLICSVGSYAFVRAENIARQADVIAALTLEVCKGTFTAFDADACKVRPHKGQAVVCRRLRSLLTNKLFHSEVAESHRQCSKVQDAYTLRCCPQVHGIVWDTIEFVRNILTTEINSATDNPLVFADRRLVLSAGNFHGEYPAKALDYLAIGVHELASMSERRIERLVNPAYSGLPAFLTKQGGLNSGFMMAHVTAAALVSEDKVLCHPSSVDSLPTSAGQEDHVSMGGFAARKCLQVVKNVEHVLAIELLCAAQALEFLRPLRTTQPLEAVYNLVRQVSPAWENDRFMAPEIDAVANLLRTGKVWDTVKPYIDLYDKEIADDLP